MTRIDTARTYSNATSAPDRRVTSLIVPELGWFIALCGVAFLIPYVLTSLLEINNDLYYLLYFAITLSALALYVRVEKVDLPELFSRTWLLSLGIGIAAAAFVVWNVFANNDSTPRPDGAYFAFELLWRGVAYGAVDALLLSAFPAAVAFKMMGGDIGGLLRRAQFAGLAFVMVLVVTATYHLGYQQFRDDGVRAPEIGNTVISLPAIASANPLGSILAHTSMHVAAVSHAYETDTFLPPQQDAD